MQENRNRPRRWPGVATWRTVLTVGAASAMLVTAWSATASARTLGASRPAASKPIVLGVVAAEGAAYDNNNDRIAAVKAALAAINKAGGINGRKVQMTYCNSEHTSNIELSCARTMISKHVTALIGSEIGNPSAIGLYNAAKIPDIDTEAYTIPTFTTRDSFLSTGGASYQVAGVTAEGKRWGCKKLFFIGDTFYTPIAKLVAKKASLAWAGTSSPAATTTNFDPVAAQVASSGANCVEIIEAPQTSIAIGNALAASGVHAALLFNGDVPDPAELDTITNASSTTFLISADTPPPSATFISGIKEMDAQLAAYYKATHTSYATYPNMRMSAVRVWLDVQMFAEIAKKLKTVNSSTLRQAYLTVKSVNGLGMIPNWTPSAKGCLKDYTDVSNPYEWYLTIKNGAYVLLKGKSEHAVNMNPYLCG